MRKQKKPESKATAVTGRSPKMWHYALAALVGLFIIFEAYQPALNGPFVFDDPYLPFAAAGFGDRSFFDVVRGLRPLLMASFWLNFHASEMQPYGYHAWNVVLHFFNGLFVFLIVERLTARLGEERIRRILYATFAAGVFLLHPLQTESVAYIASRSEALSIFFAYAAVAVFLYQRDCGIGWLRSLAVLVLFGAGALTKEHVAVLPAVLLLADYYWNPGFSFQGIWRNWRLYLPLVGGAAAAGTFVLWTLRTADTAGFALKDLTWYEYFFTQCRAIWAYLRLFLLPIGQNVDHDFAISRSVLDHGAILGLAALVALAAAAMWFRKKYPLASFGVLVFLILIAPTSSFLPIRDTLVERRFYLPSIGALLIAVEALRQWRPTPARAAAVIAGVLAVCTIVTYNRNQVWSSSYALWQDAIAKSPNKARPYSQLGYAYLNDQKCSDALPLYQKAVLLDPNEYRALVDWGLTLDCLGRSDEALAAMKRATAVENRSGHAYALIGMLEGKQGHREESMKALETALKMEPDNDAAYVYRGNLYVLSNELDRAAADYRTALRYNPRNEVARTALGSVEAKVRSSP